jgi:hypothetical protein
MSVAMVAVLALGCTIGGALAGMWLGSLLPAHHLNPESREVIKTATAVLATLAALVLGFLVSSAKNSLEAKEMDLKRIVAQILLLDDALLQYGAEARPARELLQQTIRMRIGAIWPERQAGHRLDPQKIGQGLGPGAIRTELLALTPDSDAQIWLKSEALKASSEIDALRWLAVQQEGSDIQWPFLAVVLFWLTIVFVSLGLYAPSNVTVSIWLGLCAVSVSAAIVLVVQMDQPYAGLIRISSKPLQAALDHMSAR